MQLKSSAAFSASAFVSKIAGLPFVLGSLEHPMSEKDIEIMMVVKTDLRLFIILGLSRLSSFSVIN